MEGMIRADGRVSLFEFCLKHLLTNYLDRAFGLERPPGVRYVRESDLREPATCLLGLLAWEGHKTIEATQQAFTAGMNQWAAGATIAIPERATCGLDAFTAALDKFAMASPDLKQRLNRAATVCIVTDRVVTGLEYEILRTICAALNCPFPPVGPRS